MPLGDCIYNQFTFIFKLLDLEEMPFWKPINANTDRHQALPQKKYAG